MTPAELQADCLIVLAQKERKIQAYKTTVLPWRSVFFSLDRQLHQRWREEQQTLFAMRSMPIAPAIQWTGFKLEELPSEKYTQEC